MNHSLPDLPLLDEERPFRLVFTVMYVGIISAVIYFNLVSQCGDRFLLGNTWTLIIALLLLLGIERYEHRQLDLHVPRQTAVILLLARMLLIEAVVALDCSYFGPLLYPIVPFSAYFSFRPAVSNALTVLYFFVHLGRLWLHNPVWYTNQVALTVFLVFILLLVFMQMMARVIDHDERRRRHTEQLLADLEASHVKLQAYAAQVAELAAMEERNRLARDIHDSLGHYLTAVNIQLEKAQAFWERDAVEAQQAMVEARQSARAALQDVRRSVAALRDADYRFSLPEALAELVRGMGNGRLHVNLQVRGDESGYSRSVLMALYRAAQEGLTNVQKHAQADHVTLHLDFGPQAATLTLYDDGQGFDPAMLETLSASPDHSFGLQGIRERVELVRGQMSVTSAPEDGTELRITVPKNPMEIGS
ncbi:MAG: sensor histidine kinase [Anaerolineales bacterium]|nr:sensor histidine kinase [Anaerolineales bacterium]MCB8990411.1 sensor histidine kinase [Ardenticatenaceae bacterium]MCB9003425.1 sensor histidine kinase [Ardenticatenaceae bacterium]